MFETCQHIAMELLRGILGKGLPKVSWWNLCVTVLTCTRATGHGLERNVFSIGQGSAMMLGLEPATEDMPAIADLLLRPQFIFMLLSRLVGFWAQRMLA